MLHLKGRNKKIIKYYLIILLFLCIRYLIGGWQGGFHSLANLYRLLPYLALFTIPLVVYFFYVDKKEKEYKESHPKDETKVWDITKEIIEDEKEKDSR